MEKSCWTEKRHAAGLYASEPGKRPVRTFAQKIGMKAGIAVALLALFLASAGLSSCASTPPALPEDTSAAVIIQRAQERSDVYDWKGAEFYYRTLLERFPGDPALVCTAEYEIAFTKYKRGDYTGARAGFTALLERYAAPGGESLPQSWKNLAQKVLENMPAATPAKAASAG